MIGGDRKGPGNPQKRPDCARVLHVDTMLDVPISDLDSDDLPSDIESLRTLLIEQTAELTNLRRAVHHRDLQIEKLKLQLAKLKRMQFGRSSEKLAQQIEQLELLIEALETPTAEVLQSRRAGESRQPAKVRALPDHLPREEIVHAPIADAACSCPSCGGALKDLGEDISEILDYVPSHWKVIRHVRPKRICEGCHSIHQAPAPSRPIAKSMAGAGLLAHVLVSKYADHLPLYRQSEIYAREGVELERSTLADWVGGASHLLTPLVERIAQHVLSGTKLHADDTPVPVLSPGRGKTATARLWTYVRDDRPAGSEIPPAVLFRYSPDRKGEHPRRHLQSFKGILQADAYAGFHHLYGTGQIHEAACWAHARRKFHDLHVSSASPMALEALNRIQGLYAIESELRGKPPDIRQTQRQARAGPQLDDFKRWMNKTLTQVSKKSDIASAMRYALSRWPALTRYCDDGNIEIDNNMAERALRAVALGRKNFLFLGADSGGERAANIYSLIGTAKLNGINPEAYLRHVLERIADHSINKLDELLPWNVESQIKPAAAMV